MSREQKLYYCPKITKYECEEWIWESLNWPSDCRFEYMRDGNKEFLIVNTNELFLDAKGLEKIRKTTCMALIQISTHKGHSQLWFGRYIDHDVDNSIKRNITYH